MAGTSLDGIDVAVVRTDGRRLERLGLGLTRPYRAETLEAVRRAMARGGAMTRGGAIGADAALRAEVDRLVADDHALAVGDLLGNVQLPGPIELAGFHGQTVLHAPERGYSAQLGDPARLAHALGIDVVARFREADLAAGGEGAPLAPVYQAALLDSFGIDGPAAMLNIGGVANLGFRDPADAESLLGFDCGPGNALLDDCARERLGAACDIGGAAALAGEADMRIAGAVLADPFFAEGAPKSLDRDRFREHPAMRGLGSLGVNDALATLVAITVGGVVAGVERLPRRPERIVVTGGGRRNLAIMRALRSALACPVDDGNDYGLDGDLVEAELMGFLAVRSLLGLPLTWPGTTGVARPTTGGVLFPALGS